MNDPILSGKRVAILIESEYVPREIRKYEERFAKLGAEVHIMSRLFGNSKTTFVSDVDRVGDITEKRDVFMDFTSPGVSPAHYDAVLMAANYTSVRLRWFDTPDGFAPSPQFAANAPAVCFFSEAMLNPKVVVGALCHGLWILTPRPELLANRRVICHEVVLSDVMNCGAIYTPSPTGVVIDGDLVTGRSVGDVDLYIDAIAMQIDKIAQGKIAQGKTVKSPKKRRRSGQGSTRRVLIVLSSFGYWGEEAVGPIEAFDKAGITYDFATPYGDPPRLVPASEDPDYLDPVLQRKITSPEMAELVKKFKASDRLHNVKKTADCQVDQYDGILLVGGSGPVLDMNNCRPLHELLLQFHEAGKAIAAECYAVGALIYTRERAAVDPRRPAIIRGRRVTGHPLAHDYTTEYGYAGVTSESSFIGPAIPLQFALQDAVGEDGAFIGAIDQETSVIRDGHIITSRSVASSRACGDEMVALLTEQAEEAK